MSCVISRGPNELLERTMSRTSTGTVTVITPIPKSNQGVAGRAVGWRCFALGKTRRLDHKESRAVARGGPLAPRKGQRWESNPQPPHYECGALPIEATLAFSPPSANQAWRPSAGNRVSLWPFGGGVKGRSERLNC